MKKLLMFLTFAIASVSFVNAATPVIVSPYNLSQSGERNSHSRTPILMPEVFIDGNTLTFDATCIGSVISLMQDGAIVYSAIIGEDCTIILPDYLTGIFELQQQRGSITFVGEIEL